MAGGARIRLEERSQIQYLKAWIVVAKKACVFCWGHLNSEGAGINPGCSIVISWFPYGKPTGDSCTQECQYDLEGVGTEY